MFRAVIVAAIGVFAAPGFAQEAPASEALPTFEFRGLRAGEDVPLDRLKGCGRKDEIVCWEFRTTLAGQRVDQGMGFYGGKLSWVYIAADANSYSPLVQAFDAKYGRPCETATEKWRNAMGVEVDNLILRWCFASGKLTMRRYGSKLSETAASYEDNNKAPTAKPKVDF